MTAKQQDRIHDGASDTLRISNEMVRLYKEQFGRGPTSARTIWCSDDVIMVILEDTLTPAERNLVKMGEHQRLRETRLYFQYASVNDFCEPVERITGRKIRAFISGMDTLVDGLSMETFLLHPAGSDQPSRQDMDERPADAARAARKRDMARMST